MFCCLYFYIRLFSSSVPKDMSARTPRFLETWALTRAISAYFICPRTLTICMHFGGCCYFGIDQFASRTSRTAYAVILHCIFAVMRPFSHLQRELKALVLQKSDGAKTRYPSPELSTSVNTIPAKSAIHCCAHAQVCTSRIRQTMYWHITQSPLLTDVQSQHLPDAPC